MFNSTTGTLIYDLRCINVYWPSAMNDRHGTDIGYMANDTYHMGSGGWHKMLRND